jgi:hypothetical protein
VTAALLTEVFEWVRDRTATIVRDRPSPGELA